MSSQTLFEIGDELKALKEKFIEKAGEVTDEEFDAMLAAEEALDEKLDRYAFLIDALKAEKVEQKEKETAAKKRIKTADNAAERMRDRLKFFLVSQGIKSHKTSNNKFLVATNSAPPLLIDEVDVADLPERFTKKVEELVIDKAAIEDALKNGEVLEFARYGERGTNLQISK